MKQLFFVKWLATRFISKTVNRGASKKALLCFVVHPLFGFKTGHPNYLELKCLVKALVESGYEVKVIDYRRSAVSGRYDICIGFGCAYEYVMKEKLSKRYVLYSTGMPFPYQIHQTAKALKRAVRAYPNLGNVDSKNLVRIPEENWVNQLIKSDVVIQMGGELNFREASRYALTSNIIAVPSLYEKFFQADEVIRERDYSLCRSNFIWLGGPGVSHKGLDICISFFVKSEKLQLDIFGISAEKIEEYFGLVLPKNVRAHGYVRLYEDMFFRIAKEASFLVFPSCSEAMATSVVSGVGNAGLIPIVSRQSGYDAASSGFIEISDLTLDAFGSAIESTRHLKEEELRRLAYRCLAYAEEKHTVEAFSSSVARIL